MTQFRTRCEHAVNAWSRAAPLCCATPFHV